MSEVYMMPSKGDSAQDSQLLNADLHLNSVPVKTPKAQKAIAPPAASKPVLIGFGIGMLIFIILLFVPMDPGNPAVNRCAAVTVLMATLWVTEIIPLAATSLLPLILFPLLSVNSAQGTAGNYFNDTVFLLFGGFLVAICMEKWNLHIRIALRIMIMFGTKPKFLLLGTMVSAWFLSMWISNTATTMMMIPNVSSIMSRIEDQPGALAKPLAFSKMSAGMFMGLAYAASIGGTATKIGTSPNLVMMRVYAILFPDAPEITFGQWFACGFPVSIVMVLLVWAFIAMKDMPSNSDKGLQIEPAVLRQKYTDLGPMSTEEKQILTVFFMTAALWFFRAGLGGMKGWGTYFPPGFARDGTVAIFGATLLFCLPAHDPSLFPPPDLEGNQIMPAGRKWNSKMLVWKDASKMPWDMVLLFGGGFALANGFVVSGLSVFLGDQLVGLGELPLWLIVFLLSLFVCFLTEITSNTATSNVLLPIVGALGVAIKVHPLVLMIPATMCCSFAFCLPMATPPNLLAFATGKITMVEMVKHGVVLNVFAVIVATIASFTVFPAVLGFKVNEYPEWA